MHCFLKNESIELKLNAGKYSNNPDNPDSSIKSIKVNVHGCEFYWPMKSNPDNPDNPGNPDNSICH